MKLTPEQVIELLDEKVTSIAKSLKIYGLSQEDRAFVVNLIKLYLDTTE